MLTVAVLDAVEVRLDGVRVVVPPGKTTEVLVRLALDAGSLVPTGRLIEDLWLDDAPGTARNTVQSKVSRLRRALGDPRLVTGGAAGYTLHVDAGQVDALEVLRVARAAASQRAAGDHAAAAATSATGLSMFGDRILPGAGDGGWVAPFRARLEEARLRLAEDHFGARADLGAAGELVGDLERLVALQPLREDLWALLVTALYRAGRQADALAAYRRVQRRLADELGADPGPRLRALEEQVLRQDRALDLPPLASARGGTCGNLPGTSASMVGRRAELAAVTALLGAHRLVTLVGTAGVGKTRLAVESAGQDGAPGGAWLVRLDAVRPGGSPWHAVGEVFDLTTATRSMVLDRLRGHDLLLVLDSCEHVVEQLGEPVSRMLGASPGLRVLATSRQPLGIDGEVVHLLEPLPLVDSVTLFTTRAAQQRSSFSLDSQDGRVVEEVCRSLDGLPLAIELAAARVKALSVQEIARRLADGAARFTLLADPTSHRPARRRALGAAIAWSYDLLFPDDRRGLWALACFAGGAPLPAAEAVLAALGVPPDAAVDVVGRLADRSLVGVEVGADGQVRYRLLDSIREFGLERLHEAGLDDVARAAHAAWFTGAAARTALGVRGPGQAVHLSMVRAERASIDLALDWAVDSDPLLGLRLANGFGWAWAVLGAGGDRADRIRAAVAAAGTVAAPGDRVTALLLAGWLEAAGGDLDRASTDTEQALAAADDDRRGVAAVYLAFVRTQQGRPHDVLALVDGCRPDLQRRGRRWEEGAGWLLAAWARMALGDVAAGAAACEQALDVFGPLGDRWALTHAEALLGVVAQGDHRFADATAHLGRAAEAARELGFGSAHAHHLTNLGRAQQQGGDLQAAAATLRRAVDAARSTGDLRIVAVARVRLGRVLRALGDPTAARALVRSADSWYEAAGGGDGAGLATYLLAALDADEGAPAAAHRVTVVLESARVAGDVEVQLFAHDTLARIHAEQGRAVEARAALAMADALAPLARHLVTDADRTDRDRARALL